jgi:hypothetical protein
MIWIRWGLAFAASEVRIFKPYAKLAAALALTLTITDIVIETKDSFPE